MYKHLNLNIHIYINLKSLQKAYGQASCSPLPTCCTPLSFRTNGLLLSSDESVVLQVIRANLSDR